MNYENIKMYELLKAMEKMNLDECGMAFEAFKLGKDYQHEFGGYLCSFCRWYALRKESGTGSF